VSGRERDQSIVEHSPRVPVGRVPEVETPKGRKRHGATAPRIVAIGAEPRSREGASRWGAVGPARRGRSPSAAGAARRRARGGAAPGPSATADIRRKGSVGPCQPRACPASGWLQSPAPQSRRDQDARSEAVPRHGAKRAGRGSRISVASNERGSRHPYRASGATTARTTTRPAARRRGWPGPGPGPAACRTFANGDRPSLVRRRVGIPQERAGRVPSVLSPPRRYRAFRARPSRWRVRLVCLSTFHGSAATSRACHGSSYRLAEPRFETRRILA
jgi:hypothetical protein